MSVRLAEPLEEHPGRRESIVDNRWRGVTDRWEGARSIDHANDRSSVGEGYAPQMKPRRIVVDGVDCRFTIRPIDASYLRLSVWRASARRAAQVRVRFDDPWVYFGERISAGPEGAAVFQSHPITPALVATIVRALGERHGDFAWSAERGLEIVESASTTGPPPFG